MPDTVATLEQRRETERQKYMKLQRTGYGGTNHGKRATATVLSWQPRFVVDFGCGRNDFIRELRRRGVDGLGIDFAIDQADIVAPMHAVPLASGIADAVTSFDALEHLLLEDVDATLSEMRRVCKAQGRFIFSICTRPSRITVDGQNLHPTVKPTDWWLDRIERVGQVTSTNHYIEGAFHA
jgi:SAM-dependent methyltransferase